jgi:glycosyltransferase involved in cell wall biosynthesis
VIYNGLPYRPDPLNSYSIYISKYQCRLAKKSAEQMIAIYVGSLGENYDIETIVNTVEILASRKSLIRIVVAGSGKYDYLILEAKNRYPEYIDFLGRVAFENVHGLCRMADIGIMPYKEYSTVEIPDKFFDYINAGLACITSLKGEVASLIESYQVGRLYESQNARSLAAVLVALSEQRLLVETMKKRALDLSKQFCAERQFSDYADFILKRIGIRPEV